MIAQNENSGMLRLAQHDTYDGSLLDLLAIDTPSGARVCAANTAIAYRGGIDVAIGDLQRHSCAS